MRFFAARGMRRTAVGSAVNWRKSSFSSYNGNCVEAADLAGARIGIRDSQNAHGEILDVTPTAWHAFIGSIRSGQMNL
jgi:hypothetical protein